jgi:hypothetical protein
VTVNTKQMPSVSQELEGTPLDDSKLHQYQRSTADSIKLFIAKVNQVGRRQMSLPLMWVGKETPQKPT